MSIFEKKVVKILQFISFSPVLPGLVLPAAGIAFIRTFPFGFTSSWNKLSSLILFSTSSVNSTLTPFGPLISRFGLGGSDDEEIGDDGDGTDVWTSLVVTLEYLFPPAGPLTAFFKARW